MRRLFMLLAAPAVAALAVGCCHTHGVCDCDTLLDDHCNTRAPWVAYSPAPEGAVPYHGPETIPAPKTMPKTAEPKTTAPKTAAPKTEVPRKLPDVAPKF